MITAAFYIGEGTFRDRVVRAVTRSRFSHVELVFGPVALGGSAQSVSASARDGGVRTKLITFHADRWVLLPLPWATEGNFIDAESMDGVKYDLLGAMLTQLPCIGFSSIRRWFCSELIAWALGLRRPERFDPGTLFDHLSQLNTAFNMGRAPIAASSTTSATGA